MPKIDADRGDCPMHISGFDHKGVADLYSTGRGPKGLDPKAVKRIRTLLTAIAAAQHPNDLRGQWDTHELTPRYPGFWSMDVIGSFRLTFYFDAATGMVSKVNYLDYHGKQNYKL
jgi:plasmid maintenance system killer protein